MAAAAADAVRVKAKEKAGAAEEAACIKADELV